MKGVYGVIQNGVHIDVSNTELGAKMYATRNGLDQISCRYNCGYVASIIATKVGGKWIYEPSSRSSFVRANINQ